MGCVPPVWVPLNISTDRWWAPVKTLPSHIFIGGNNRLGPSKVGAPNRKSWIRHCIVTLHGILWRHILIQLPNEEDEFIYEVELGVVIGETAYRVSEDQSMTHVKGYCLALDMGNMTQLKQARETGKIFIVTTMTSSQALDIDHHAVIHLFRNNPHKIKRLILCKIKLKIIFDHSILQKYLFEPSASNACFSIDFGCVPLVCTL